MPAWKSFACGSYFALAWKDVGRYSKKAVVQLLSSVALPGKSAILFCAAQYALHEGLFCPGYPTAGVMGQKLYFLFYQISKVFYFLFRPCLPQVLHNSHIGFQGFQRPGYFVNHWGYFPSPVHVSIRRHCPLLRG